MDKDKVWSLAYADHLAIVAKAKGGMREVIRNWERLKKTRCECEKDRILSVC